ncbi:MAG: hypothetical protein II978_08535 [Clostridia bacterium]|nr:hypothetical protein [Clostridia bacterium]
MLNEKLVKRCQKLAFYGVVENDTVTYYRMSGFTEFSKKANPKEYKRQYIDEEHERNDVVGYSPVFSYEFDQFDGNKVHSDLAALADGEYTGTEAIRSIIVVDFTDKKDEAYGAVKRDFAVIPDSEGGSSEAYTYSGSFKASGDKIIGTATSNDNWKTLTFTEQQ